MFDQKITSSCKNDNCILKIALLEIAKDNAFHILTVHFLSCSSCCKGLEDNILTHLNKSRLTSHLCAFTVDDNMNRRVRFEALDLGVLPCKYMQPLPSYSSD